MEPFGLQLYAAPASEPVTATEAKARLQVTVSDLDSDITQMITDARALAEAECGRAFITQTWNLTLDDFPHGSREILIPRPPLASVTHVKYYDEDGVQQTLSSSDYHVATGREPGRVVLKQTASWPAVEVGRPDAVEVRFVAGVAAASLAPAAKAAVLVIIADKFENPAGAVGVPPAARRLLDSLETGQVY